MMEHPEIKIACKCKIDSATASYSDATNLIEFYKVEDFSDNDITGILLHELDHWMQSLLLTDKEKKKVAKKYNKTMRKHKTPFLERAMFYVLE